MIASAMEDPAKRKFLAELYVDGLKRKEIAAEFGVVPDTISGWLQRQDVKALVTKLIEDRANRILRHTDKKIEGVLLSDKKIELDELLKIRREFAGSKVEVTSKDGDKSAAVDELMQRLHDDPTLIDRLVKEPAVDGGT
jgi:transposase